MHLSFSPDHLDLESLASIRRDLVSDYRRKYYLKFALFGTNQWDSSLYVFPNANKHVQVVKTWLQERVITSIHFLGAGELHRGNLRWGSDTCRLEFCREKPSDKKEADLLLSEARSLIRNWLIEEGNVEDYLIP